MTNVVRPLSGVGGVAPGGRRPSLPTIDDSTDAPVAPSVIVPPDLALRYDVTSEVSHGGQALVMLGCDRETGAQVALKYYVQVLREAGYHHAPAATARLDHPCLVRTLHAGLHAGHWWEVMEWCSAGTLADLVGGTGGAGLADEQVRAVLMQVAAGLAYLHRQGVIHRDLKPENVLLRSRDPLDLALADFGTAVASGDARSVAVRSMWVSAGYSPFDSGVVSPAYDYWALGIMCAEALLGHHPLWIAEITDPLAPNPTHISAFLRDHEVPLDGIDDPRWRRLCEGLLTRDRAQRWGIEEITCWLAGDDPPVAPRLAPSLADVRVPFAFAGRPYVDPAELGRAMGQNWRAATRLVLGRDFDELVRWLLPTALHEAVAHLRDSYAAGGLPLARTVAHLLVILSPTAPPTFGPHAARVDRTGLQQLASAAMQGQEAAGQTLTQLYDSGALRALAGLQEHSYLAVIQEQWEADMSEVVRLIGIANTAITQERERIEQMYRRIGREPSLPPEAAAIEVDEHLTRYLLSHLLAAQLSPDVAAHLAQRAHAAVTRAPHSATWLRDLLWAGEHE